MTRRRGWLALGAGLLPALLLSLVMTVAACAGRSADGVRGFFQDFGPVFLFVAVAAPLSMALMVWVWDRLSWRPRGRVGWSGVFLIACLLGATLTGLFTSLISAALSLLVQLPLFRQDSASSFPAPGDVLSSVYVFVIVGVLYGFMSLAAPLGGLLFVLLARQAPRLRPARAPARYTPPHD